MNLFFLIGMFTVNAVFFVSSLFKELNSYLSELCITEYVFFLFNPFSTFFTYCIEFRLEKVCRTAVNRFCVTDYLLSEFRINRNWCLAVFASYNALEFLCYSLVAFACNYVEYSLCTDNL